MTQEPKKAGEKVSGGFHERLASLGSRGQARAILLLAEADPGRKPAKRLSAAERQARIEARVQAAQQCVPEIDAVLESHGGRRLEPDVNALGTIAIETTAKGFEALARLPGVKAIVEDQPIRLIP